MNINNKLTTFAGQQLVLGYNASERERIKASQTQLEKKLEDHFEDDIDEFLLFGSYTRNTILPRNFDSQSDIDLMVVFNTGLTPGTYRKNLHDFLKSAYPNSLSKKDFPVVKLELNHIMFDIVPAYCEESNWSSNVTFYIPDYDDGWRETVPNDLNDTLSSKNQSYGENIVRNVIRLCKLWNSEAGYPFQSYEMEKEILGITFLWGDNLYEKFISILDTIAGNDAGVSQAINYIKQYKRQENEMKQLEWLQKLLPGLK